MTKANHKRVRKSIQEIERDYKNGNTQELENLMTAWAGINTLAPSDFGSFFVIDGFYGDSFRENDSINSQWWSEWWRNCNLLFPSQHTMYLMCLEKALQSIQGCENVMLPHWNESDRYSFAKGFPSFLTDNTFTYTDGTVIKNPLISFTFPMTIIDSESYTQAHENELYIKNLAYKTLRHTYTGLVGNPEDQNQVIIRNTQWSTLTTGKELLNQNIINWLNMYVAAIAPCEINKTELSTFPICDYQTYKDYVNEPNHTATNKTAKNQANNHKTQTNAVSIVPVKYPNSDTYSAIQMTLQKLDNKILMLNQLLDIMEMWAKTKHLV